MAVRTGKARKARKTAGSKRVAKRGARKTKPRWKASKAPSKRRQAALKKMDANSYDFHELKLHLTEVRDDLEQLEGIKGRPADSLGQRIIQSIDGLLDDLFCPQTMIIPFP